MTLNSGFSAATYILLIWVLYTAVVYSSVMGLNQPEDLVEELSMRSQCCTLQADNAIVSI